MRNRIRRTWDDAARSGRAAALGTDEPVAAQLDRLFALVGARAAGDDLCLEIGCGTGRMTAELARRWSDVLAVDVSPEMLARARALPLDGVVRFELVSGDALDGVADGCAGTVVCYGVLQHVPTRRLLRRLLGEIGRTLAPGGEAIIHLPVLRPGLRARLARAVRAAATRIRAPLARDFTAAPSYRGARLTERELAAALRDAGLRVQARGELASYFAFAANVVVLLTHTP